MKSNKIYKKKAEKCEFCRFFYYPRYCERLPNKNIWVEKNNVCKHFIRAKNPYL